MAVECCDVSRCPFLVNGNCIAATLDINSLAEHIDTAPSCDEYVNALYAATAPQRTAAALQLAAENEMIELGGRGEVC